MVGENDKGEIIYEDKRETVIANTKRHELDALIVIGGDGSLNIANKLSKECGVKVVGVPKTIDNDLPCTRKPWLDTAMEMATEALEDSSQPRNHITGLWLLSYGTLMPVGLPCIRALPAERIVY
jgi:6-phosphofructokinase